VEGSASTSESMAKAGAAIAAMGREAAAPFTNAAFATVCRLLGRRQTNGRRDKRKCQNIAINKFQPSAHFKPYFDWWQQLLRPDNSTDPVGSVPQA
jgi:hypothetical protein